MTWYPDLGKETMVAYGDYVRAIGWLSNKHPFPSGNTPAWFLDLLETWCRSCNEIEGLLAWPLFCGPHKCELCHQYMAIGNIGVPAGEVLFVAPQMVAHYVKVHNYAPPAEFLAALLRAPFPHTPQYRAQIAPFRRAQDEYWERRRQQEETRRKQEGERERARRSQNERLLQEAASWASKLGGNEQIISDAAHRFFGHRSPELCERIRACIRHAVDCPRPPTPDKRSAQ